jgi:signal transduction histidine kinase
MRERIQSPQSWNLRLRERERTLAGILKVGAGVCGGMLLTAPLTNVGLIHGLFLYVPGVLLHLAHFYWLRWGNVRVVAISHCLTYFVWVTAILVFWVGGLGAQAALVYPPLIVMAALIWSGEAALGFAALIAAIGALLTAMKTHGLLPLDSTQDSPWPFWLVLTACVIVTSALMSFALGIIRNTALERMRLEEKLWQAQRLDALGRLAGGVAHDFNNLLSVILGSSELLQLKMPSKELDNIEQAAIRASKLTRALLAFGRGQALLPEPVELNSALAEIRPLLLRLLSDGVQLEIQPTDDPCYALVDHSQLDQIFLNLVGNARDAMPDGGVVTIACGNRNPSTKNLIAPGQDAVWLSVQDTGIGLTAEVRERLFEPFFSTKEPDRGTGLGLATVHGIVTQSGGSIVVESAVNRGTTFWIVLPTANTPALVGPESKQDHKTFGQTA